MGEAEIVLGMEDVARELAACARGWEPDARLLGNVRAADVAIVADAYPALLARLRDAERERDEARNGKAGIDDILQTLHAQVAEMCAFAGASPDAPQDSWTLRDRLVVLVRERTRDDHDYVVACRERDEARAALIQAQEDHRAAVEGLETYEERIGDIADHVLGLVAPDVPSIIKLDAIERRCGEERIAARRAEARVAELEAEAEWKGEQRKHRPFCATQDDTLRADVARLRAQLAEAREVLQSVEWDSLRWDALTGREQGGYCVVCGGEDPRLDGTGHAPDCRLAAALENS